MKYYPTLEFSRSLGWEIGIRTPLQESLKCGEHIYPENISTSLNGRMKKPAVHYLCDASALL